jgi:hypothetical protein
LPTGAPQPVFGANGTNAAKNPSVQFATWGTYRFGFTIADAGGQSVSSMVWVLVNRTVTSIVISPDNVDLPLGGTQQFAATAYDQFGNVVSAGFTWSATAGSISLNGLYTAPTTPTTATVQAVNISTVGTTAVNVLNAPPTNILLSNASVDENLAGAVLGALSTVDPDPGQTFAYLLVDDPTDKFEIVGNTLKLKDGESLDYEAASPIELLVRTTDTYGSSFEKAFTIAVRDLPEPPTDIQLSNASLDENQAGAVVGTLFTVDPDLNEGYSYLLVNDPTGKFEIAGDALKLKAGEWLDHESTPTVELRLRTTDGSGLSLEKSFTVSVNDLPEPPTDILLSNAALDENALGAVVGTLSTVDPDLGDTFAYLLVNDPTGKFEIAGDALKLKDGERLDHESTPTVELRLRTTDGGGLSFEKAFTIAVNDLPESLVVGVGDWTAAGLTLQLGADGKIHVYRTGGTEDAVPPHDPANVLGVDVTGGGLGDVMTVVSMGAGIPELSLANATLILDRDDALPAGAKVTVDGGALNFNGHAAAIGNLLVKNDGQVVATAINNSATTVASGTLSATSIVCDSLIIGTPAPVAASAPAAAAFADSTDLVSPTAPASLPPAVDAVGVAAGLPDNVSSTDGPVLRDDRSLSSIGAVATSPVAVPLVTGIHPKLLSVKSAANAYSRPLPLLERPAHPLEPALSETLARAKAQLFAARERENSRDYALQSLMREWQQDFAADPAASAPHAERHLRKPGKLVQTAVDELCQNLIAGE